MVLKLTFLLVSLSHLLEARPPAPDNNNADAFACLTSGYKFHDSSLLFSQTVLPTTRIVSSYTDTSYIIDTNVPLTTLCDGRPRALESYRTTISTHTTPYNPALTLTEAPTYPTPTPPCTIAPSACPAVLSRFSSDQARSQSSWSVGLGPEPTWDAPCWIAPPRPTCPTTDCFLTAATSEGTLYYWPVTTTNGDFCKQNGSTITPTPTAPNGRPNTAVVAGMTFTSPTNYIALSAVGAGFGSPRHRTPCGPAQRNVLVPLTAGALSSSRRYDAVGTFSFNYADLKGPVPTGAWDGQWSVETATIEGVYRPDVLVPTQVVGLEAGWGGCRAEGTGARIHLETKIALGV